MIVNFTKMHGLGNDFVVIDLITQGARLNKNHITRIANRTFGIGCDQVILITPPTRADADFFYRIYNSDGTEVEQCGNGVRCAAKFFIANGLTNKSKLEADCLGGTMELEVDSAQQQVTVNLGKNYTGVTKHQLNYAGLPHEIYSVSTGNPHGVCIVTNVNDVPIKEWGAKLTIDPIFPNQANIGFMQIVNRDHVILRVFERGVGPTLACGSAACAALLVGKHLNLLNNRAKVEFAYGDLIIDLQNNENLYMTGPATSVYIGRFRI
jgi:diaminopimelate epimerase